MTTHDDDPAPPGAARGAEQATGGAAATAARDAEPHRGGAATGAAPGSRPATGDDSDSAGSEPATGDDSDAAGSELRITVARSGGLLGTGPRWTVTASAEADVDSWLSLVESCPWDAPEPGDAPAAAATVGGADRFVYTIRVFLPSAEERDARVPEQRLDGPWRDLVDRVKDAGHAEPHR